MTGPLSHAPFRWLLAAGPPRSWAIPSPDRARLRRARSHRLGSRPGTRGRCALDRERGDAAVRRGPRRSPAPRGRVGGSSLAAAATQGTIAALVLTGTAGIPILIALSVVNGAVSAVSLPARRSRSRHGAGIPPAPGECAAAPRPERRQHRRRFRRSRRGRRGRARMGSRDRRCRFRRGGDPLHPPAPPAESDAADPARRHRSGPNCARGGGSSRVVDGSGSSCCSSPSSTPRSSEPPRFSAPSSRTRPSAAVGGDSSSPRRPQGLALGR